MRKGQLKKYRKAQRVYLLRFAAFIRYFFI